MVKNWDLGLENTARGRKPFSPYRPPSRQITYVLSEIVIAGRFLSKLCPCDIWLVDSNIVFVFFELNARWESLEQELTVFSVEFSSCAYFCSLGAGQLEYIEEM